MNFYCVYFINLIMFHGLGIRTYSTWIIEMVTKISRLGFRRKVCFTIIMTPSMETFSLFLLTFSCEYT